MRPITRREQGNGNVEKSESIIMDEMSYDEEPSENWERFMILWSVTPEFFIGSCIICVVAIIYVVFTTKNDKHDEHILGMEGAGEPDKTNDGNDQQDSQDGHRRNGRPERGQLRNRKKGSGTLMDLNQRTFPAEEETSDDHLNHLNSPYKKSRYRMAAEKLEASLTDDQLREEREIQRQQLKAIFDMMKEKQDVFGIQDLSQVEEQLKYYG